MYLAYCANCYPAMRLMTTNMYLPGDSCNLRTTSFAKLARHFVYLVHVQLAEHIVLAPHCGQAALWHSLQGGTLARLSEPYNPKGRLAWGIPSTAYMLG